MSQEPEPDEVPEDSPEQHTRPGQVVHSPGQSLVRQRTLHEIAKPFEANEIKGLMAAHQAMLESVLDNSDWQGEPGADQSFVKKSGWRKIATAYNLSLGRVTEEIERDADGLPLRASYTAWAETPTGRRVEATGHCAKEESRFRSGGGRQKLENDLRATAETRAKNRAISDLVGMGKVSAEETDAGASPGSGAPVQARKGFPFGNHANEESEAKAHQSLAYLGDTGEGVDDAFASEVIAKLKADAAKVGEVEEHLPGIVSRALLWTGHMLRQKIEQQNAGAELDNAAAQAAASDSPTSSEAAKPEAAPAAQQQPPAEEVTPTEVIDPNEPTEDDIAEAAARKDAEGHNPDDDIQF